MEILAHAANNKTELTERRALRLLTLLFLLLSLWVPQLEGCFFGCPANPVGWVALHFVRGQLTWLLVWSGGAVPWCFNVVYSLAWCGDADDTYDQRGWSMASYRWAYRQCPAKRNQQKKITKMGVWHYCLYLGAFFPTKCLYKLLIRFFLSRLKVFKRHMAWDTEKNLDVHKYCLKLIIHS